MGGKIDGILCSEDLCSDSAHDSCVAKTDDSGAVAIGQGGGIYGWFAAIARGAARRAEGFRTGEVGVKVGLWS